MSFDYYSGEDIHVSHVETGGDGDYNYYDHDADAKDTGLKHHDVDEIHRNDTGVNVLEWDRCYKDKILHSHPPDGRLSAEKYCKPIFDKWICWDWELRGHTSEVRCPTYFHHTMNPKANATKQCMENGEWFPNPIYPNQTWTNYTACWQQDENTLDIIYVAISGYVISTLLLVISVAIFFYFSQLKCPRVTLHQNLFISYILTGVLWIITYSKAMLKMISEKDTISCSVLLFLTNYASVCNYFWMLCEGIFLHTVVVMAFVKQAHLLYACYVIGWGIPLIITIVYVTVIHSYNDSTRDFCWGHSSNASLILTVPILLSLVTNLALLLNILRILLSKMRAVQGPESNFNKRKTKIPLPLLIMVIIKINEFKDHPKIGPNVRAVKATLILVPLLGVHNLFTSVKPGNLSDSGQYYWDMFAVVLISFQGAVVAIIFCFLNSEVIDAIKGKGLVGPSTTNQGSSVDEDNADSTIQLQKMKKESGEFQIKEAKSTESSAIDPEIVTTTEVFSKPESRQTSPKSLRVSFIGVEPLFKLRKISYADQVPEKSLRKLSADPVPE